MVRQYTHDFAPVWRIYTEIKISTSRSLRQYLTRAVDWVLPGRNHPARLGCALAGHCEGQFRTAKHLIAERWIPK